MGLWDILDDARREIAWKAEKLVDSVKDVASDIADGTMKENIQMHLGTWEENKKEISEGFSDFKKDMTPLFNDMVDAGIKEVKENPLKGGAIVAAVAAAPVLAAGVAGAGLAALGQAAIVGTATKLVSDINADSKIQSECNKVKAATEVDITKKYAEQIAQFKKISKEHADVTSAMICTYLGGQALWNERNGGKQLTDDQYAKLIAVVAGFSDKTLPKTCKIIFDEYKEQVLTIEQAKKILLSKDFSCKESLINECFTEIFTIVDDIRTSEGDDANKIANS